MADYYTVGDLLNVMFIIACIATGGTLIQLLRYIHFICKYNKVERNMMKTYGIHVKYDLGAYTFLTGLCWVAYCIMDFFKDKQ